jgi:hypothetical protein
VMALYLYCALLFVFGFVLFFGELTCHLQHALEPDTSKMRSLPTSA